MSVIRLLFAALVAAFLLGGCVTPSSQEIPIRNPATIPIQVDPGAFVYTGELA